MSLRQTMSRFSCSDGKYFGVADGCLPVVLIDSLFARRQSGHFYLYIYMERKRTNTVNL